MSTFGNTGAGIYSIYLLSNNAITIKSSPSSGDGYVDNIKVYAKKLFWNVNVKACIWNGTTGDVIAVSNVVSINSTTAQWWTFTFSTPPAVTNGTNYYIGIITAAYTLDLRFTITSGGNGKNDTTNSYTTPQNIIDGSSQNYLLSVYVNYTPGSISSSSSSSSSMSYSSSSSSSSKSSSSSSSISSSSSSSSRSSSSSSSLSSHSSSSSSKSSSSRSSSSSSRSSSSMSFSSSSMSISSSSTSSSSSSGYLGKGRSLSKEIKDALASNKITMCHLFEFEDDDSNMYRYTTLDVPLNCQLESGGPFVTFTPRGFRFDSITYSSGNIVDDANITVDNLDSVLSALFLDHVVQGYPATIYLVLFEDSTSGPQVIDYPINLFSGDINSFELTESEVQLNISSIFTKWSQSGHERYSKSCRWKVFGGTRCKYAGAEDWCDRTFTRCSQLANTANFGGFRWLPTLEDLEIWWGDEGKNTKPTYK